MRLGRSAPVLDPHLNDSILKPTYNLTDLMINGSVIFLYAVKFNESPRRFRGTVAFWVDLIVSCPARFPLHQLFQIRRN